MTMDAGTSEPHLADQNGHADAGRKTTAIDQLHQEEMESRRRPFSALRRGVRDITADFVTEAKQLPSGKLIKDESFTLFEAVGALEIMDPKMDSGYVPEDDTFEPDFDTGSDLDAGQVLWIVDELLRLEMSFHDGYPLSQNIFTSLHIFRLISPDNCYPYTFYDTDDANDMMQKQSINQRILRPYCIAVIKCVDLTLRTIQAQTFYEEEDFVTYLFGRELLPKLNPDESRQMLDTALNSLEGIGLAKDYRDAIEERLRTRWYILSSLSGTSDDWEGLKSRMRFMSESTSHRDLATPVPNAFSDKVTRQLATSTPPRPMPTLSWEAACQQWEALCDDVVAAQRLTSVNIRKNPHSLQRAAWIFSSRDPPPNAFARAKMQEILTLDEAVAGDVPQFDLMLMDIRNVALAGTELTDPESFQIELPTDRRHKASRILEEYMSTAFGEYLNFYRMVCQNRCRMRRTFTQAIPLLDDLEGNAREADRSLAETVGPLLWRDGNDQWHTLEPLASWTKNYKLCIMAWVIQLGFETDLYRPREMHQMYAALCKFSEQRLRLLQSLEGSLRGRAQDILKNKSHKYYMQCFESLEWLSAVSFRIGIENDLAYTLGLLWGFLESTQIIDTTQMKYEEEQLSWEARFKPFLGMKNDPIPTLEVIKDDVQLLESYTASRLWDYTNASIRRIKNALGEMKRINTRLAHRLSIEEHWNDEVTALEKVSVATSVAAMQIQQLCKKHGKADVPGVDLKGVIQVHIPPPGKRYHDWWAVPQISEVTISQSSGASSSKDHAHIAIPS